MALEKWQSLINEMRGMPSLPKSGMLKAMPVEFWRELGESYPTLTDMGKAIGLDRGVVGKYLDLNGIPYSKSHTASEYRSREELLEAIDTEIAGMGVGYAPVHLDKSKDWAIMPDVHGYNVDMVWFNRFLAVAKHYGITNLLGAGDFHDFAALSVFADKTRGYMPSITDEISVTTKLEQLLAEQFTGDCYMLIANHEIRLAKMLRQELEIEWLFEKLFPQTRWVDCDHIYIGGKHDIAVVHPDKAWLNSYSLADDYARANECDVLMAHAHVWHTGYARNGHRVMCIGGLFNPEAPGMRYSWRNFPRVKMQRGFVMYVDGVLLPFAEGFVRWEDYGCS